MTSLESGKFASRDGTRLYGEWTPAKGGARGVCVVLHGYADHAGRYGEVAAELAGLGLSTLCVDYRGHGRADGLRGHCMRFDEFIDDLEVSIQRARAAVPSGPLLLVAHSHGGLVALRGLCDPSRPIKIDGVVLSSPFLGLAMKVAPAKELAGKIASRVYPTLSLPNELDPKVFTHDKTIVAATERDSLCFKVATARWFTEMVTAHEYVKNTVHRLVVPSLWLVAGDDRLVSVEATRNAFGLGGGEKQLKVYDGLYHEIFNELSRAAVFKDMTDWIRKRFLAD
jgi:lysophospholipase